MHDTSLPDADELIERLSQQLRSRLARRIENTPLMIGIQTGGLWVAEALASALQLDSPLGRLDIGFYRDDFARAGLSTPLAPSHLPWPIENRHLVLVDDVLYTGRTIRAALNEIFDYGRPASITLAVLVARDGRELPIQADVVGTELALPAGTSIKLRGPGPLRLELISRGTAESSHV
jgi:pyrimidine operon attenuation protein / uracil phosphoribosyltransferase